MTDTDTKLRLKEAIIVEGRYDRIRLSGFIASPIIETGGFRVFKDKERQALIRSIAERRGILIMTDVDSAGFVIRNFLRGIVPADRVKHAYIPTVIGKERRKAEPSKEGVLGVEGLDREALIESIRSSGSQIVGEGLAPPEKTKSLPLGKGAVALEATEKTQDLTDNTITKLDFFEYGLTGSENSARHREEVLSSLGLPKYLTVNAMISAINCLFTKEEFEEYLRSLLLEGKGNRFSGG